MGDHQAPDPPPLLISVGCFGSSCFADFCLPFALKQRCFAGWVIHSLCMYADTM